MSVKIFVSRDLGASYNHEFTADGLDDPALVDLCEKLDAKRLRHYIADDHGDAIAGCRLHGSFVGSTPYKQRPIETHVQELSSRFVGKKTQRKRSRVEPEPVC